jgi:hypothetical protein
MFDHLPVAAAFLSEMEGPRILATDPDGKGVQRMARILCAASFVFPQVPHLERCIFSKRASNHTRRW